MGEAMLLSELKTDTEAITEEHLHVFTMAASTLDARSFRIVCLRKQHTFVRGRKNVSKDKSGDGKMSDEMTAAQNLVLLPINTQQRDSL